jgi:hypothetical protein
MSEFIKATHTDHCIRSKNLLLCKDTDRVVAAFYHEHDLDALLDKDKKASDDIVKIIQFQAMPNDAHYQGEMLGLADNGVMYIATASGWEVYIPLEFKLENKGE